MLAVLGYVGSVEKMDIGLKVHFITETCDHMDKPYSPPLVTAVLKLLSKGVVETAGDAHI